MTAETLSPALDPGAFAKQLLGRPLWDHQLKLARSKARFRIVCAGRQVGKSAALASITLYEAATRANILVLLVSAGEVASRRLLEECASLAGHSPVLRGSVLDESKSSLTLSNGSRILSVPASERQIRGWSVDLLVVDEAAFVDEDVWSAAEPAIVARPGSRVILTSTPFGVDHFFRRLWRRGMDGPGAMYESWHWPSSISPLMDQELLEDIRQRENPITFEREYEAKWADASGALLTPDELQQSVVDYDLIEPDRVHRHDFQWRSGFDGRQEWRVPSAVAGVDYGAARDAHALAVVAAVDDQGWNDGDHVLCVPWLEVHHKMAYAAFLERVVAVAQGYNLESVASETNGVGAFPTEQLGRLMWDRRQSLAHPYKRTLVVPVWTDARRKQSMFGMLKGLLQSGRLILPRHPELLSQLAALQMTEMASGSVQISVPESRGHDDLAMALGQALSSVGSLQRMPGQRYHRHPDARPPRTVELASGVKVPMPLRLLEAANMDLFRGGTAGVEKSMPW